MHLYSDLKFGLRMLWKTPWASAAIIFVMAIGIGANAAIFSLFNEVLLRPPPGEHAERVVSLGRKNLRWDWFFPLDKDFVIEEGPKFESLESVGMATGFWMTLSGIPEPRRFEALRVTKDFFDTIGLQAKQGRLFVAEDFEPVMQRVMLLADELWSAEFQRDPAVIGESYLVNGEPYTVVGILPRDFEFEDMDFRAVVASSLKEPSFTGSYDVNYPFIGRLRPGATKQTALMELTTRYSAWREAQGDPRDDETALEVKRMNQLQASWIEEQLWIIQGVTLLILCIAVFNVVNLLLARARQRRNEMGIRAALGASPNRLFRQVLVEYGLYAVLGAAAGLAGGYLLLRWILRVYAGARWGFLERVGDDVHLDSRVLFFTLVVTVVCIFVLALGPAWMAARAKISGILKEGGRGASEGRGYRRFRSVILGIEIALTCLLLISATLFSRSMSRIVNFDSGFNPDNVIRVKVDLPFYNYATPNDPRIIERIEQMREQIATLPGVVDVATGASLPAWSWVNAVRPEDVPVTTPIEDSPVAHKALVGPGYFDLFEIPMVAGRDFSKLDNRPDAERVAIVSRFFVEEHYPNESPIDQVVELIERPATAWPGTPHRIVGVVEDLHRYWMDERYPDIFTPEGREDETFYTCFWVRYTGNPGALFASIRDDILTVEPETAMEPLQTVNDYTRQSSSTFRFLHFIQILFACTALVLATVGVFSVVSYSVTQRRREMGTRLALGAQPRQIRAMILKETSICVGFGILVGVGGMLLATQVLQNQLMLISPYDPATYIAVVIFLFVLGVASAWLPARRASSTNPSILLREM